MFNLIIRVCLVREGRIIQIVRCMLDFLLFLLTLFFLKFLIDQAGLKLAMNDLELSPRPSPLEHWHYPAVFMQHWGSDQQLHAR